MLHLLRTPVALWACGHLAGIEAAILKNICSEQLSAASAGHDLHCLGTCSVVDVHGMGA